MLQRKRILSILIMRTFPFHFFNQATKTETSTKGRKDYTLTSWLMEMECRGFTKQSEVWSQDNFPDEMLFPPSFLSPLRGSGVLVAPAPKAAYPDLRAELISSFLSGCVFLPSWQLGWDDRSCPFKSLHLHFSVVSARSCVCVCRSPVRIDGTPLKVAPQIFLNLTLFSL